MPNVYNRGKKIIGEINLTSATLKLMLLKDTYSFDVDDNTRSDITADECDVSSYAATLMTTVTITQNDTSNEAEVSADRVAFSALEAGNDIGSCVVFQQIGGSPAPTDPLLCHCQLVDTATNGQVFRVDFSGNNPGIFLTHA